MLKTRKNWYNNTLKKANAILEYGILLIIVVGAVGGLYHFLRRHIQARVRHEARSEGLVQGLSADPGPGQGLEWAATMTASTEHSGYDRFETPGGGVISSSSSDRSYITASAPPPSIQGWSLMEHKGEAIHVQDAPSAAPSLDYPDLEYKDWKDLKGEWDVKQ